MSKARQLQPGDRVKVRANAQAICERHPVSWGTYMDKAVGKYRVVATYEAGFKAVTFVGDTTNFGMAYLWPVEALRFVRSKAQAREAQRGWRGKRRNPIKAPTLRDVTHPTATATLKGWRVSPYSSGLLGRIYGDTKGRFADGTEVVTSSVAGTTLPLKQGDLVQTRNSVYLLGEPA